MKRTLFIALFSLLSFSSFGQKIQFSDSTNEWTTYYYSCGGDPITELIIYRYSNDTIIHDTVYKQLHSGQINFVREDTVLKKIFAITTPNWPLYDTDTAEQLLYDYTLNVGDTFKTRHAVHHVSSIDSVIINGIYHKVWYLHGDSIDPSIHMAIVDYYVVEGIGCLNSPIYPLAPYFFEQCTSLTCFSTHDTIPPLSHTIGGYFDNTTSCNLTFGLSVKSIKSNNQEAIVIANPIDQTSKIVFSYNISSGSVVVLNDMGQVVINTTFQNKDQVLIGDKVSMPGIYFYRVVDDKIGSVFSGKFVKY